VTPCTEIDVAGVRVAAGFYRLAALAMLLGLCAGLACALPYVGVPLGPVFRALRPIHTLGTIAWIYLAGIGVVHRWLFEKLASQATAGDLAAGPRAARVERRSRLILLLWGVTGVLATAALLAGKFSGREYFEFPPIFSIPLGLGWVLFAWSFLEVTRLRLREEPVFVWMWATSVGLFAWTFVEAHAWLLDVISSRPVRDLAVQWKSYGSLVGSFNLLVYGSLSWLGSRRAGNTNLARSNLTFALFLVGILNSFTNYGHHTYHLPQSPWVKWIAFVISMTEVVILAKVVWEVAGLSRRSAAPTATRSVLPALLAATSCWTAVQLLVAIVISIPPLNAVIHGTLVVAAHAMGSVIGIDTMALLAAGALLLEERGVAPWRGARWAVNALNGGLAVLWGVLMVAGIRAGLAAANEGVLPWSGTFPVWLGPLLLISGVGIAGGLGVLLWPLLRTARVESPRAEVSCSSAS
jgi:nitric oxide reductase subunit B